MLVTTQAIGIRTIAHSDHRVVLRAWTRHAGMRSYMVRTSRRNGITPAALLPLNRLELVADEHEGRDLHVVRELRVVRPFVAIPFEPVRGAVALFVQEVLHRVLRTEGEDLALDGFLHEAIESIDTAADLRCFPLVFLLQLSGHLGFFPGPPSSGTDHFDLQEGSFTSPGIKHDHTVAPPLSTALMRLLDVDLAHLHEADLATELRRSLLDHLLLYYRLHLDGLEPWRSPAVLQAALN
ncbi:MAG: recombination protein O N-terminal domain-containing protein [Flavobacteriales bacterium]|nr:recombination protein O N-terminal domain-containing protein [Flavobacteriales bacterium]